MPKKSTFIQDKSVPNDHFFDTFGKGVNRKISKPDLFNQIRANAQTYIYQTQAEVEKLNLQANPDNPVYFRVAENDFKLYEITTLEPGPDDFSLDNGTTATHIAGFVPDAEDIPADSPDDNVQAGLRNRVTALPDITALAELDTGALVDGQAVEWSEFWPGTGGGFLRVKWVQGASKTLHDGVDYFDPGRATELNSSTQEFNGWLSAAASGTGCFVRADLKQDIIIEQVGLIDGSPSAQSAAQRAIDRAAATGRQLVGDGSYTINGDLNIPSGLKLLSRGGEFLNCSLKVVGGGLGDSAVITSDVEAGASSIPVNDSSAFSPGDYVRIISCINAQSPGAGDFLLGDRRNAADITYLSEFSRIYDVQSGQLFLETRTIFPYSVTPDADSGTRTDSEVYKVDFADDIVIEGLKVQRSATNTNEHPLTMEYAGPNVEFRKCELDCSGATYDFARPLEALFCYGCSFVTSTFNGITYQPLSGSAGNVIVRACQDVSFTDICKVNGGNQGIDITTGGSTTIFGGPSIRIRVDRALVTNTYTDGLTTHWGCYQNEFSNCVVKSRSSRGVRVRSKGDVVRNCWLYGEPGSQVGISVEGILFHDIVIESNHVYGFLRSIETDFQTVDYDADQIDENLLGPTIRFNHCFDSGQGLYAASAAQPNRIGTRVYANRFFRCVSGLHIAEYHNGLIANGNEFIECVAGTRIQKDNIGGIIEHNYYINCSNRSIRGTTASGNQVEDTTTFGTLANGGYSIRDNYYINSPTHGSLPSDIIGLSPTDVT